MTGRGQKEVKHISAGCNLETLADKAMVTIEVKDALERHTGNGIHTVAMATARLVSIGSRTHHMLDLDAVPVSHMKRTPSIWYPPAQIIYIICTPRSRLYYIECTPECFPIRSFNRFCRPSGVCEHSVTGYSHSGKLNKSWQTVSIYRYKANDTSIVL